MTVSVTSGSYTLETTFKCNVTSVGGVDSLNDNGKVVVNEEFYNAAGAKVAKPENGAKAVYVVVKTYDDGTTEVVKEVR